MAHNNTQVNGWFADVPAWEGNDTRPAQLLADELVAQGRIGACDDLAATPDGESVASADEWGWLGVDEGEAPLTTPHVDVDEGAPPVEVDEPAPVDVSPEGGDSTSPPPMAAPSLGRPRRARRAGGVRVRRWLPAAVIVAVGVLVVAGVWAAVSDRSDPQPTAMPTATSSAAPPSSAPADDCPSETIGAVTTGRDAGDQNSGPGVIKAFNYAYYRLRDARAAQSFTAKSAGLNPVEMQGFIDRRPVGTSYCLEITDRGGGLYAVQLTETPPDGGAPTVFSQLIQTTQTNGKTWIATNRPA